MTYDERIVNLRNIPFLRDMIDNPPKEFFTQRFGTIDETSNRDSRRDEMIYNAQSDSFTITKDDLKRAAGNFMYALRSIRETAGLPLDKHKRPGPLEPADHAQKGVIDGARAIGIDLGADWGNELDLRDKL